MIATRPELFKNILISNPEESFEYGFFVFRFFKNGKWEYVFIDSSIPIDPNTKAPIYGKCVTQLAGNGSQTVSEFWVPLIEKAYAKLHGCYEAINGGSISQALVDLTGGIAEKYFFESLEIKDMIDNE